MVAATWPRAESFRLNQLALGRKRLVGLAQFFIPLGQLAGGRLDPSVSSSLNWLMRWSIRLKGL
jgi:hypothetical protein